MSRQETKAEVIETATSNGDVDIQPTEDQDGGFNVGWVVSGEWLEYDINVNFADSYSTGVRVAAPTKGAIFTLEVDGRTRGDAVILSSTGGWQSKRVELGFFSKVKHVLRLQVQNGGFNFNWLNVWRTTNVSNAATALGRIQIEANSKHRGGQKESTTDFGGAFTER